MKTVALETIRPDQFPDMLRVHADEGLAGPGETVFGARASEACLRESAAMTVLGRDPLAIAHTGRDVTPCGRFRGQRGRSP